MFPPAQLPKRPPASVPRRSGRGGRWYVVIAAVLASALVGLLGAVGHADSTAVVAAPAVVAAASTWRIWRR